MAGAGTTCPDTWSETSHAMQRERCCRDNPVSADAENEWRRDGKDPGITPKLTRSTRERGCRAIPYVAAARSAHRDPARPRASTARSKWPPRSHAARASTQSTHMTDLQAGRRALSAFSGPPYVADSATATRFGAGRGWAASILINERLRDELPRSFADGLKFALGVCNGCQMLANLKSIIPERSTGCASRAQMQASSTRRAS